MLTFFRRIRKGLLEYGATSKYLLYAIGEIALVVIGILIALQINNWNESRKDRIVEGEYYQQLINEINLNVQKSEDNMRYQSYLISNAELILKFVQKDTVLESYTSLAIAIEHVGWTYYFQGVSDVWNDINSTGNLRLIRDSEVSLKLKEYYRMLKRYNLEEKEVLTFSLGVRRILAGYLPSELRMEISDKVHPERIVGNIDQMLIPEIIPEDLNTFQGLQGYLVDIIIGRRVTIEMLTEDLVTSKELLHLLNAKL